MSRLKVILATLFVCMTVPFFVSGAVGADAFQLTLVSQNSTSYTFSYPAQPGYGYLYFTQATATSPWVLVNRTTNPDKTTIKFAKGSYNYKVSAIVEGNSGTYTTVAVDTQAPSTPNGLSASAAQTSYTFSWNASTDNVGVTGYEVFRNGVSLGTTTSLSFNNTGLTCNTTYTAGVRAKDAAGNNSSTATLSVTTSACTPPPAPQCSDTLDNDGDGKIDYPADPGCTSATDTDETDTPSGSVTLTPVDGGTNYYSQFTNGASMDSSGYFPISVWGSYNHDQTNLNLDYSIGLNTYVWVADSTFMSQIRSDGRFKVIQAQEENRSAVGSETAGWLLADELDMTCGPPGCDGYTQLDQIIAGLPNDGRLKYSNYGKGVIFWEDDPDAARWINGRNGGNTFQDVVSDDIYWFSDGGDDCTQYQGGYLFGVNRALTQAECRRASNYGTVVEKVRRLDAMDGVLQPVWGVVETGHPFSDGQSITSPQIRAAVWHSIIAGARGILYFQHSFGGTCGGDHHTLRTNCEGNTPMVTSVNAQIKSLAPVLNSPTVTSGFASSATVKAMAKWDGSNFYVFAGSTNNASSTGTFSLPCVGNATATVVGENRSVAVSNGGWSDSFADGNAVHIYRIDGGARCGL